MAEFGKGVFPHQDAILLNTGRNALEYILRSINDVKHLYLPYYTCEAVLEPLHKLNIPYIRYHIDAHFEIVDDISTGEGEYIIANNYFGIKDSYIQDLAGVFGDRLIIDCAQSFFATPIPGIKMFYSPRKFVGVADGGVAYVGNGQRGCVTVNNTDCTSEHDSHLLKRKKLGPEAGFVDFQANEEKIGSQPIRWMSVTTKDILNHIDYDDVVSRRRNNFKQLHQALSAYNVLSIPTLDSFICPMVYPLVVEGDNLLRQKLMENRIYVASYWRNVLPLSSFETEYQIAQHLLPLPCDQRYGRDDMNRIIQLIKEN